MASATKARLGPLLLREYQHGSHNDSRIISDQAQVWTVNLKENVAAVVELRKLLSMDEIARADKFRFESGRNEFTITRGVLRTLLGVALTVPPQELSFSYSSHGKPLLAGEFEGTIELNVSHSDGMAVVSFARNHRLGVDVEKVRLDFEHRRIAERFFSENERKQLRGFAASEIPYAFFRCWTRKEAFIKAIGEGLSHPLSQFDVDLHSGQVARLLNTRPDPAEASRWTLFDIPVPAGYVAALAMEECSA